MSVNDSQTTAVEFVFTQEMGEGKPSRVWVVPEAKPETWVHAKVLFAEDGNYTTDTSGPTVCIFGDMVFIENLAMGSSVPVRMETIVLQEEGGILASQDVAA